MRCGQRCVRRRTVRGWPIVGAGGNTVGYTVDFRKRLPVLVDFLKHLIRLPPPGPAPVAVMVPPAHQTPRHVFALLGHLAARVDGDLGRPDEVAPRPTVGAGERARRKGVSPGKQEWRLDDRVVVAWGDHLKGLVS